MSYKSPRLRLLLKQGLISLAKIGPWMNYTVYWARTRNGRGRTLLLYFCAVRQGMERVCWLRKVRVSVYQNGCLF